MPRGAAAPAKLPRATTATRRMRQPSPSRNHVIPISSQPSPLVHARPTQRWTCGYCRLIRKGAKSERCSPAAGTTPPRHGPSAASRAPLFSLILQAIYRYPGLASPGPGTRLKPPCHGQDGMRLRQFCRSVRLAGPSNRLLSEPYRPSQSMSGDGLAQLSGRTEPSSSGGKTVERGRIVDGDPAPRLGRRRPFRARPLARRCHDRRGVSDPLIASCPGPKCCIRRRSRRRRGPGWVQLPRARR